CCTGTGGRVRVNARELEELAMARQLSVDAFTRIYTRPEKAGASDQPQTQWTLKQAPDDKQCVFLEGSKCSVYQGLAMESDTLDEFLATESVTLFLVARPTQCRTFPWWPQHLASDYDWQLAAANCEGIHVSDDSRDEADDVPTFSMDDVLPETILHDIHRSGENFTYDELSEMLRDLREVEPDFVAQYKAELFANASRQIVYHDDQVTVLDSFFAGASPVRSFVFNDRLHLTQSELALQSSNSSAELEPTFDRSTLALDVHRALCMPLAWLPQRDQSMPPLRVAVLGAGACTLPLFLLEHLQPRDLGQVDAVEPSAEVNSIAQRFFGVQTALQCDKRIVVHEQTGETFLAEQAETPAFDLVVVDVEAGESHEGVLAPPLAMLEAGFLLTAKRLLVPHGILALNVITESEQALESVETRLGSAFPSSGLRLSLPSNTVFFLVNAEEDAAPLDVDECVRRLEASAFQRQHAETPALVESCRLTKWSVESPSRVERD
ncbi:hypothetical protein BBJ28_00009462, partial [Nothophytophthora sp. Chile5]